MSIGCLAIMLPYFAVGCRLMPVSKPALRDSICGSNYFMHGFNYIPGIYISKKG